MVENVAAFERKFLHLVPQIVEEKIRAAMEAAAKNLVSDLKKRVPVYAGPETTRSDGSAIIKGALRDSIGWTWGNAPKGSIILGSAKTAEGRGLKITIYAGGGDAFYARWVEHGTVNWSGSPFFFGTYRDHKRRIKGGITRALRAAIREANSI